MCCKPCRKYAFWYLVLCDIVYSLCYFYRNSIVAITDALQKDFKTDASGIGLLASFIFASYFCMQLICGLLLEIYSFQLLLFLGAFGLGLTSVLFGIANNIIFAAAVRFVAGIALAPLFITGITIGAQRYGNQYVGLVTGILLFSSQSLFSILVTFQAWFYDEHGLWREVYYGMGIIAFLVSFFAAVVPIVELKRLDEATAETHTNPRAALKKAAAAHNIKAGQKNVKKDVESLKRSATAPLLAKSKFSRSSLSQSLIYRADLNMSNESFSKTGAMLQSLKRSLTYSQNWVLGLQQFSLRSITYALNGLWIVAYLQEKFYFFSPASAATVSGVFFISSSFGSLLSGKLMLKYQKRKIFLIIGVFMSQFCLIFIYGLPKRVEGDGGLNNNIIMVIIYVCNVISGFGAGFLPVGFTIARELNDKYKCSDTATGMVNMLGNAAGLISQLVVSFLIDVAWTQRGGEYKADGEREYEVADYQWAFLWIPCTGIIGFIGSILVTEPTQLGSFISLSSFISTTARRKLQENKETELSRTSKSVNDSSGH